MTKGKVKICFVCLGNICRSPTAEGVMKQLVKDAGLADRFFIDSSGTGAYHVGDSADGRSRSAAKKRGILIDSLARQFKPSDFDAFDYVVAMDRENHRFLRSNHRSRIQADESHLVLPQNASETERPLTIAGSAIGDFDFEFRCSLERESLQSVYEETRIPKHRKGS